MVDTSVVDSVDIFFSGNEFPPNTSNRLMNYVLDIVQRNPWPVMVVSLVVVRVICPEIALKDPREHQELWVPREEAASIAGRRTISPETALKEVLEWVV